MTRTLTSLNIKDLICQQYDIVNDWLCTQEQELDIPLYTSLDIRDSGFKAAVVDTNLFPAGFNNLEEQSLTNASKLLYKALIKRVPHCKHILLIIENHSRNTWYLENVRILKTLLTEAGFTTFPAMPDETDDQELFTATGQPIHIYALKNLIQQHHVKSLAFDLIFLNNDLSKGKIPQLNQLNIPIYPEQHNGWYQRKKSIHFNHAKHLINEFSHLLDVDPWFFSCLFTKTTSMDIHLDSDRQSLYEQACCLYTHIQEKYQEHKIEEKPYLILKADSGTYGMGVIAIEKPDAILSLNRKLKNKLHKGKGSQINTQFILQEGIPSNKSIDQYPSEICIYKIENDFIGGFYRYNSEKSHRDNLNSTGMRFKTMKTSSIQHPFSSPPKLSSQLIHDSDLTLYRVLGRLAGIAAAKETMKARTYG